MTTVRIAHAEPRPGKLENGGFQTLGHLIVLADDAGHRAVPVWLGGEPGEDDLAELVELAARPAGEISAGLAPEELTARLLHAAGASVTGVDIDVTAADAGELSPQSAVTRIGLSGPAGTRHITAGLGLGLFGLWYLPRLKRARARSAEARAGDQSAPRDSGSKTVSSTETPGRSTRS